MKYNVGYATDIGLKRKQNQDSGGAFPELGLFLVSDGMGGHRGGEIASSMAVQVIHTFTANAIQKNEWEPKNVLKEAIQAANQAIFEQAQTQPELQGMGTTTTALLIKNDQIAIGHAGDSRCYFFRPNALWQTTRDHSLVQDKLKAGLITRKELKTDRMKNVITRSVGFEKILNLDLYQMNIEKNDCYLLCSDGLSSLIEDSKILQIVQKNLFDHQSIQQAADELIAAANSNGGDDNITVLLLQVS